MALLRRALFANLVAIATFLVAAAAAVATTANAQDVTLQQLNDTLFLAGPGRVSWALDEPIRDTLDTMIVIMRDQSPAQTFGTRPTPEMMSTRALFWEIFGRQDCSPTVRADMNRIRTRLLNEPRRRELYQRAGVVAPNSLRLDTILDEIVRRRTAACSNNNNNNNNQRRTRQRRS